jgi:hypothetical protein
MIDRLIEFSARTVCWSSSHGRAAVTAGAWSMRTVPLDAIGPE